jgi:hypothetical protein
VSSISSKGKSIVVEVEEYEFGGYREGGEVRIIRYMVGSGHCAENTLCNATFRVYKWIGEEWN